MYLCHLTQKPFTRIKSVLGRGKTFLLKYCNLFQKPVFSSSSGRGWRGEGGNFGGREGDDGNLGGLPVANKLSNAF